VINTQNPNIIFIEDLVVPSATAKKFKKASDLCLPKTFKTVTYMNNVNYWWNATPESVIKTITSVSGNYDYIMFTFYMLPGVLNGVGGNVAGKYPQYVFEAPEIKIVNGSY
jgi:hypothetical protein